MEFWNLNKIKILSLVSRFFNDSTISVRYWKSETFMFYGLPNTMRKLLLKKLQGADQHDQGGYAQTQWLASSSGSTCAVCVSADLINRSLIFGTFTGINFADEVAISWKYQNVNIKSVILSASTVRTVADTEHSATEWVHPAPYVSTSSPIIYDRL